MPLPDFPIPILVGPTLLDASRLFTLLVLVILLPSVRLGKRHSTWNYNAANRTLFSVIINSGRRSSRWYQIGTAAPSAQLTSAVLREMVPA